MNESWARQIPLEPVDQNEALSASETPRADADEKVEMVTSSRIPATGVQTKPGQLKEAKNTSAYQRVKHSNHPVISLTLRKNQRIFVEKAHAQKTPSPRN